MTSSLSSKPAPSTKKKKQSVDSFEIFKPSSLVQAISEQIKPNSDWAKDWLGFASSENHGKAMEMQPGVAYSPSGHAESQKHEQAQEAPIEAPIEVMKYKQEILHAGEGKREEQESGQRVQMLIQELQRLAQSVQQIEKTMLLQAIDPSAGKKTGKYYESFFEWMLIVVQDARRKVEDSGAWLTAMQSKKKPGIHQQMKTNMKIAMSGERTNANNTG